jgi:hypothetical protein
MPQWPTFEAQAVPWVISQPSGTKASRDPSMTCRGCLSRPARFV